MAALAIRAITLVDPEVVAHSLTRDIVQHSVTILSFTADLLDIVAAQRTGHQGICAHETVAGSDGRRAG